MNPNSDDGNGGGDAPAGDEVSSGMDLYEGGDGQDGQQLDDGQGGDGQGGDGQQPQGGQAQNPALTAEAIAKAFHDLNRQSGQPAQPAQPQQMTEEEFNKTFHVFNMNEELLNGLRSDDPAKVMAAYNEMAKHMVRNAVAVAAHLMGQETRQLEGRFKPVMTYYQEQQTKALEGRFYAAHPKLKGFEPIVNAAATAWKQQNPNFTGSEADAFKGVASLVEATLKKIPGAQPAAGQQRPQNGAAPRKMSTVSSTGGPGGASRQQGQQGGGSGVDPTAKALYGPRRR